ncbi:alpha-galactosidase [Vagococcus sp.]|uniref:alpha-galactosidase n=1 Tax=Vagococcus sp. TaxID=1933889 RepID=UPI003F9AA6EE
MIHINKKQHIFHLSNHKISYIITLVKGVPTQIYFGKKIKHYSNYHHYPTGTRGSFAPNFPGDTVNEHSLAALLQEYPGANQGDYRQPGFEVSFPDGASNATFRYDRFEIIEDVVSPKGLPSCQRAKADVTTLRLILKDVISSLELSLYYTIFKDSPFIIRKTELTNLSDEVIKINQLASFNLDLPEANQELIHLPGTWGAERQLTREKISIGIKRLESRRGTSSHNQNPFFAIVDPKTTERQGDVLGFSLIYSGNHEMIIQKDSYEQLRLQMGINHETFQWKLNPDESFITPEAILGYSEHGLTDYSQQLHQFIQKHIVRSKFKDQVRPILMNNWEATYMAFTEEKIVELMEEGANLGVELFVLDDGWFGKRNSDDSSLGDWFVNEEKLPKGLSYLAEQANQRGIDFGLWLEPEMVSPNSELFRNHPDWVIHYDKRGISPARMQYVLDLGREDVQDYLFTTIAAILNSANISYIKWDMNRNFSETYANQLAADQQGEAAHRFVLGLYALLERITKAFPDVLFESCSGGGGRFDLGMLAFMPQIWTSDNTDAIERLKIQYGTSLAYPIASMGAHVSASPNHQNGRMTTMATRGNVAMSGLLGYELDLTILTTDEKEEMKQQIAFYKKHRQLIQYGDFYRISSPYEGNETAWMFVSQDKSEAIFFYCHVLTFASPALKILKLQGLAPEQQYHFENGQAIYGDELMNIGMYALVQNHQKAFGDFETQFIYISTKTTN